MDIKVHRINDKVLFKAENKDGASLLVEGSPSIGGEGNAMRPMEVLLASLATCSSMDLVEIIRKQRMELKDLAIEVHGDRFETVPSSFSKITMHFKLTGNLDASKVEKALELAVRKYCSVEAMLIKAAEIDYTWEIIPV